MSDNTTPTATPATTVNTRPEPVANVEGIITENRRVLHFTADWCGPCKVFDKELARVQKALPGLPFEIVDVDAKPDIVKQYDVQGVPFLVVLERAPGAAHDTIVGKMLALRTTEVICGFLRDPATDVDP